MNDKELLNKILDIERGLLEDGRVDKEHLILLRCYLFMTFGLKQRMPNAVTGRYNGIFNKIKGLFRAILILASMLKGKCSKLVFAPVEHRNVEFEGLVFSKAQDSLVHYLGGNNGNAIGLDVGSSESVVSESSISPVVNLLCRFFTRGAKQAKDSAEVISEKCTEHQIHLDENRIEGLERYLCDFEAKKAVYSLIFKALKPEEVYVIVYYMVDCLAITNTLRKEGIPVIEYQHGIQNKYQPMYASLHHICKKSPLSLPNQFYTWNAITRGKIENDIGDEGTTVTEVGYLWKDFFTWKFSGNVISKSSLEQKNKTVVLALQAFPRYFNFDVLVALRGLDKSWNIVVREHPLAKLDSWNRHKFFKPQTFNANIQFDNGTELLDVVLDRASYCITGFSSVGFEASLMGLTTIFTHEMAKEGLAEYIDEKTIFYQDTSEGILNVLHSRQVV